MKLRLRVAARNRAVPRDELVFYTNPSSRGQIVRWMLEELEAPYVTIILEYGQSMKAADYLAINPMGKVPAIRYGETVITETPAICMWLAEQFPQMQMMPAEGTPARGLYYRWMFFAAGPLESALTARACQWTVSEERRGAIGFGTYADTLRTLEYALSKGPYICGTQFTAADIYIGSCINWGLLFGTLEKRPAFERYVQRLNARPAAIRAFELDEALRRA
jgi:glutathione S-transferase